MGDPERDRFLLSKGHGPMAYCAVLVADGFFDEALLPGFGGYDSPLGHHPDRLLVPGAEIGSGSLRDGLPPAVGSVLGRRAQGLTSLIRGPGSWSGTPSWTRAAITRRSAYAGPAGLDRLHTLVIDNASATCGRPGRIVYRFEAADWSVRTVDGRDHEALYAAFTAPHPGRPHAVIAHDPRGVREQIGGFLTC